MANLMDKDKLIEGARLEFQRDMVLVLIMRAQDNPDKKVGVDELKNVLNQLTEQWRALASS